MKNKTKKRFAVLLAFIMAFTVVGVQMPITISAKTEKAISFFCTNKTVAKGGTYTLTVQGVTDKKATYSWSSSDKKIATVSKKGVVKGVSEGSTTIKCKVTLSDKSTKTLSCKVTVKEQKAATSVKITKTKLGTDNAHSIVVGESYDFNRKLSPSTSNDKTYWYILDEEYATVDSGGLVTAKKAGTTTLIAKVGIDRIDAERADNKVVDSIRLNIINPSAEMPTAVEQLASVQEISKADIGDYVTFGTYEQDNNQTNGAEAIEWQVLDKKEGKVLLLSKYSLDAKPYHEKWESVTWETCTLRSWLNKEFYTTAFNSKEQKYITETYVVNRNNLKHNTIAGENTYDKIFLLSIDEVTTYFNSDQAAEDLARRVQVTEYAKAQGAYFCEWNPEYYGNSIWRLRSPGNSTFYAANINYQGSVSSYGSSVDYNKVSVRPALWIEVESAKPTATPTPTPMSKPTSTAKPTSTLKKIGEAGIGDYVTFGTYEQDNDRTNGTEPIEWQVLDKKDGKVFLLSKCVLDVQPYHERHKFVTWETCTLRSWLNTDFYNKAFNSNEQKYIAETYVVNGDNWVYNGTNGGKDTYDKIFLLSLDEVLTYCGSDLYSYVPEKGAEKTEYAQAQLGAENSIHWWLRTPGFRANQAAVIAFHSKAGIPVAAGYSVFFDRPIPFVRPALWVEEDAQQTVPKPTATPKPATPTPLPVIPTNATEQVQKFAIGDYVTFGTYEQDNNTANGKEAIVWQVLDNKDGKVMLLSKYALDVKAYHTKQEDEITWETCTLRSWLNKEFYNTAFNNTEKKYIAETYVVNDDTIYLSSDGDVVKPNGGNNTYDKVFLLSVKEVRTYFDSALDTKDSSRVAQGTKNVVTITGRGLWWLRSPAMGDMAFICEDGSIVLTSVERNGISYDCNNQVAVRPVIWIEVGEEKITTPKPTATPTPKPTPLPGVTTETIKKIEQTTIGDYVTFGMYEQDADMLNGEEAIEWQVLDKKDGKVLLISKYGLDAKPYHGKVEEVVTWETSTLRSWLNTEFYNKAFNSEEQKYIAETYVVNEDNPEYGTDGGKNTYDKLFLLSLEEATTYFTSDSARRTPVTRYARVMGAKMGYYDDDEHGNGDWWLRSPGNYSASALYVFMLGNIGDTDVNNQTIAVRPALWIKVK